MVEFLTAAFSPVNVVFTVLLLVLGLYWILVILGAFDIDLFHIDLPHGGPEFEADADGDVGHDIDGLDLGVGHAILQFFYFGEVPTMLLVSVMALFLWAFSMLGNHYLNPEHSPAMALAVFVGNFAVSTVVLKFVALPLRTVYIILNKDYNAPGDVVGKTCQVVTTHVTRDKMGQAQMSTKGAPLLLNVLSQDDDVFNRGEEALVVERDVARGTYRIAPMKREN
ncbi:MAG TPA: hypothetical protein VLI39_15335 [Sedimentisphaerales bacterium]|nr:hypothetical protein [Sedimentisphaerales bacterium]